MARHTGVTQECYLSYLVELSESGDSAFCELYTAAVVSKQEADHMGS